MTRCFLGLGSNERKPLEQLRHALINIKLIRQTKLLRCSSIYLSTAFDDSEQALFYNAVVEIETALSPHQLLSACQAIEKKQERVKHRHWGPRTLDIDLLLYGNKIIQSDTLSIPHQELTKRDFVIVPLLELSPTLSLPCGTPIKSLQSALKQNLIKKRPLALSPV